MWGRVVGRQLSRRGEGEGELEKISELNTTRTIEKLWSDKHAVNVQQAGDNSSTQGQLAMRKRTVTLSIH